MYGFILEISLERDILWLKILSSQSSAHLKLGTLQVDVCDTKNAWYYTQKGDNWLVSCSERDFGERYCKTGDISWCSLKVELADAVQLS